MSKNLPAKHFQENKGRLKKQKLVKNGNNMVVNITKICQKMKNKCLLSIGKNVIKSEKMLIYNYKKVFKCRKFFFFVRRSIKFFSFSGFSSYFLKYKKSFQDFPFLKCKKSFILRKYKKSFAGFLFPES